MGHYMSIKRFVNLLMILVCPQTRVEFIVVNLLWALFGIVWKICPKIDSKLNIMTPF